MREKGRELDVVVVEETGCAGQRVRTDQLDHSRGLEVGVAEPAGPLDTFPTATWTPPLIVMVGSGTSTQQTAAHKHFSAVDQPEGCVHDGDGVDPVDCVGIA